MSVVILGGNECMERRYRELCESYQCQSKIFTKPAGGLRNKLGSPDLTIFFTNTMSHKMVQGALSELKGRGTIIERCHTSSLSALRGILDKYAAQGDLLMSEEMVVRQCRADAGRDQDRQSVPMSVRGHATCCWAMMRAFNRRLSFARGLCLLPLRFTEGKRAAVPLPPGGAAARSAARRLAKALLADAGYPCGSCERMRCAAGAPHARGRGIPARGRPVSQLSAGGCARASLRIARQTPSARACGRSTATNGRRGRAFDRYQKMYANLLRALALRRGAGPAGGRRQNQKGSPDYEKNSSHLLERHRQHRGHGKRRRGGYARSRRGVRRLDACGRQRGCSEGAGRSRARLPGDGRRGAGRDGVRADVRRGANRRLRGKSVGLFGSYGWGDGEWMRTWEEDCGRCRDQPCIGQRHLLRSAGRRGACRLHARWAGSWSSNA